MLQVFVKIKIYPNMIVNASHLLNIHCTFRFQNNIITHPPEPFSVTRPPKGGVAIPSLDFLLLTPYTLYSHQCIAMDLPFPLTPK